MRSISSGKRKRKILLSLGFKAFRVSISDYMESWVQNRTDLCCWSRWWATALLLSGAHQMHHKSQRENLVLQKCNKFENKRDSKQKNVTSKFLIHCWWWQVLETRTEFGARVSAPLLAMGTGLLLSGCRIVPPTAPAYDLVCLFKCPLLPKLKVPSPVKNDQLYFLWVTFTRWCLPVCRNSRSWTLGWFALIQWSEYTT